MSKLRHFVFSWLLGTFSVAVPATVLAADAVDYDSTRLHIEGNRQFFFDDAIIESHHFLTRKVHRPEKMDSPVLRANKPWERRLYFTCNTWRVIRDPKDGLFKCWYEDWMCREREYVNSRNWRFGATGWPARYLFATSKDGVHWEKPELGIVTEDGRNTNIILGDPKFGSVHAAFVLLDSLEQNPRHRYKMLYERETRSFRRMEIGSSPDGIHWKPYKEPLFGKRCNGLGDVVTVAIDEQSQNYLLNSRHIQMFRIYRDPKNPASGGHFHNNPFLEDRRRVFQTFSADLQHWAALQPIVVPDGRVDNIDDEFYGMSQYKTGGFWIGFLHVFHETQDTLDVQLVYSRDGRHFKRFRPGRPWLTRGERGSWDQYMVNMPSVPVESGDDLFVFYGGAKNHHDWWISGREDIKDVEYCLGLAKMKRDRYVSLRAESVHDGKLVTRPFKYAGGQLVINAKCDPDGSIVAEIADADGNVIPGFSRKECVPFTGDEVAHEFAWKGGKKLSKEKDAYQNNWRKIHFYVTKADIFTFEYRDEDENERINGGDKPLDANKNYNKPNAT